MKKGWKIVLVIVMVALLLGAVAVGVGLITGADMERIYRVLDSRYQLTAYYEYSQQVMGMLLEEFAATPVA